MIIRPETPVDYDGVRRINGAAFEQDAEGALIDALRCTDEAILSLVAESDGGVVGHIFFTRVVVKGETDPPWTAAALGPMAVAPTCQRTGIGSALVRAGLKGCLDIGWPIVFVLGHPGFYPRFGFKPAPSLGITCPWDVPSDVFMVAELEAGALAGRGGLVRYAAAFDDV